MTDITQLLGKDAESLLQHRCITIPSDQLYLPGADYVDRVMVDNNRPPAVLRNMQTLYNTGRLGGTGYLSILPVDPVSYTHLDVYKRQVLATRRARPGSSRRRSARQLSVWRRSSIFACLPVRPAACA